MLRSPDGLVFSRFIVDIAGELRSGLTERGGNNPFDAGLNCCVDEYLSSQYEFSSSHYIMEVVELTHLCKLVEFEVLPSSDDQNLLFLERLN
jgi:hypothetical protein